MDMHQILSVLEHDSFTSNYTCCVLALNHLLLTKLVYFLGELFENSSLIVTIYNCDEPESYWVAVLNDRTRNVEYFDSNGLFPIYFIYIY